MVDKEEHPGNDSEREREIALTWAREAERRNREMDETGDEGIPAEEVFRRLRLRTRQAKHEEPQDPH